MKKNRKIVAINYEISQIELIVPNYDIEEIKLNIYFKDGSKSEFDNFEDTSENNHMTFYNLIIDLRKYLIHK